MPASPAPDIESGPLTGTPELPFANEPSVFDAPADSNSLEAKFAIPIKVHNKTKISLSKPKARAAKKPGAAESTGAQTDNRAHALRGTMADSRAHPPNLDSISAREAGDATRKKPQTPLRRSQELFERMKLSTPMKADSQNLKGTVKEQKAVLMGELKDIPEFDAGYLKFLYGEKASDTQEEDPIKTFLETSGLYVGGRWIDIPQSVAKEKELYPPLMKIIKAIVKGPGKGKPARRAIDTHNTKFVHHDGEGEPTRPDIAIMATGPSFQTPLPIAGQEQKELKYMVGYSNVAAVFDVKRDADNSTIEQIQQLMRYNRQIFITQPNRKFCRSFIITETRWRLLHFDHSGAYLTGFLKLNEDPYTFVRAVLALSSLDEEEVGLDSSIQWTTDDNGRKNGGTITTVDLENKEVVYRLIMTEPPVIQHAISGTGTVCWYALEMGDSPKRVLIKDTWRADGRTLEYDFLTRFKDVKGIATKVLGHEDTRAVTRSYRPKGFKAAYFFNRSLSRIVLRSPGPSLLYFTSQEQVIVAIRDAIKAHRNLLLACMLHRDITVNNIILVEDGGKDGPSALLSDLAMAMPAEGEREKISPEGRTGNKLFLSYAMHRNGGGEKDPAPVVQDYLDDLEAFFYVFCRLLYGFKGIKLPSNKPYFLTEDMERAADRKKRYLSEEGPDVYPPPLFWSPACIQLCEEFGAFVYRILTEKVNYRKRKAGKLPKPKDMASKFSLLYDGIDGHYSEVIGYFDAAIDALREPGCSAPRPAPTPPSSPSESSRDARFHSLPPEVCPTPSDTIEAPVQCPQVSLPPTPSGGTRSRYSSALHPNSDLIAGDRRSGKRLAGDALDGDEAGPFKYRRGGDEAGGAPAFRRA